MILFNFIDCFKSRLVCQLRQQNRYFVLFSQCDVEEAFQNTSVSKQMNLKACLKWEKSELQAALIVTTTSTPPSSIYSERS
jgi:hypothetical protein